MKKLLSIFIVGVLVVSSSGCKSKDQGKDTQAQAIEVSTPEDVVSTENIETVQTTEEVSEQQEEQEAIQVRAEEIVSTLTIEQKAAQMVQPAIYEVSVEKMQQNCYGSVLSLNDCVTYTEWQSVVDGFQQAAVASIAGIPFIYGNDDVHGVNYCDGAVLFPHNIGIGAANDPELTYEMGLAVADEAKLCHMLWNFSPCVAQSEDPRWGRTYESYGSNLDKIETLGAAYTSGLCDGGIIACAKHFFGDGNVEYGTGEDSDVNRLIDRGDSLLSDTEIEALLNVYQSQIDAGVQTIMISHSSINGVKMHENSEYIQYLKNEMGFNGFIVSDWNSVQNTSATSYEEQVINSVNSGIDMLMEVADYDTAMNIIITAVSDGRIEEERVDDAVTRIIKVKIEAGVIDDPFFEELETEQATTGSEEYRELARELVQKSLVLLKNEGNVLPFEEGTSVYITGPAADNAGIQCGGWTRSWNGSTSSDLTGVTTILDGFIELADEYGITVITDPNEAQNADCVLLVVGEQPYAEWNGDTEDLQLCGQLGLAGNMETIQSVEDLNKPTVACIVAGRNVIIEDYYDKWDSVVMCYLPGSEGQGVADVLCGEENFAGKLPAPWYNTLEQIGTDDCWLEEGFGLSYED